MMIRDRPARELKAMNEARTQSYSRVVKALYDLGPSKLQPDEQALIRDAADGLIFCAGPGLDQDTRAAMDRVEAQLAELVRSGRWTEPTAHALLADLAGCGPRPLALGVA